VQQDGPPAYREGRRAGVIGGTVGMGRPIESVETRLKTTVGLTLRLPISPIIKSMQYSPDSP
jgi:hypothetical protein